LVDLLPRHGPSPLAVLRFADGRKIFEAAQRSTQSGLGHENGAGTAAPTDR
jgi:hypothetical protein